MASIQITQLVDDLISRGRIQPAMKDQYINLLAASPELEGEFSSMLLRGGDYTNKTKQLAEERRAAEAQLQAERAKFQEDKRKLDQWQARVQEQLDKSEGLKERNLYYEQALRDYDIYDQVVTKLPSITDPKVPSNPTRSANSLNNQDQPNLGFLRKDEAAGAIRDLVVMQEKADLIKAQHFQLYGTYLTDNLVSHALSTGEDMEQYWKIKYGVDAKKAELATKNREAERAAMREELRAELQREYTTDPSRLVGGLPLGQQGGISPLLEAYSHSKALQHSQPNANDNAAKGDFVPPEQKPALTAQWERVNKATDKFAANFGLDGNPISDEGRRLAQRYGSSG